MPDKSKKRRIEIAKKASAARWGKKSRSQGKGLKRNGTAGTLSTTEIQDVAKKAAKVVRPLAKIRGIPSKISIASESKKALRKLNKDVDEVRNALIEQSVYDEDSLTEIGRGCLEAGYTTMESLVFQAWAHGRPIKWMARVFGWKADAVRQLINDNPKFAASVRSKTLIQVLKPFQDGITVMNELIQDEEEDGRTRVAAFKELKEIVHPRHGGDFHFNMPGPGGVVNAGPVQNQQNVISMAEALAKDPDQLEADIKKIEAKFKRPPPPAKESA